LPEQNPQVELARELDDTLFPDGVRFTQLKYRDQWVESQTRIDLIVERGFEDHFRQLGGQPFLDILRAAHADYGMALGLTAPDHDDSETLQERRVALLGALRLYVVQVSAHADPDVPETELLVERLLRPLAGWQPASAYGRGSSGDDSPEQPDEPAEPAAPGESGESGESSEPAAVTAASEIGRALAGDAVASDSGIPIP